MNNETETIDLKRLFDLLLSRLWLVLLVAFLAGGGAFFYTRYVMPLQYSSHISMYVQSYTSIKENQIDFNTPNNISNSKQLINTYIEVMKDDAVMGAVALKLEEAFPMDLLKQDFKLFNEHVSPSSLRSCISISSVTDTSALTVVATTRDPEISAAICNNIAAVAPDFLEKAVNVGSINTIDTAKVYNTPVGPNITKNTAIGFLAGFVFICGLLVLIDFCDNSIKESENVTKRYNRPVIGEVQSFSHIKKKKKRKKNADDFAEDPHVKLTDENVPFYIVESYKSIRTNLTFSLSTMEKKVFVVSSSNPSEGKSTFSSNIAIAFAQSGKHTLLIDADMRKSVMHKIFETPNRSGLSTAISGIHPVEECIQKNVMENLDIMPTGPVPPNPSELLASKQMRRMLDTLCEQYSMIIIDTPPLNVVTDAMELAKIVSGIVVVLRYGETTIEDNDTAMKRIELSKMNVLGFVLNDIKIKKRSKYYSKYKYKYKSGYGYGYGYGYGHSHSDSQESDGTNEQAVAMQEAVSETAAEAIAKAENKQKTGGKSKKR